MFGVSRGRIISAIITTIVLTALVASYIVFVLRPSSLPTSRAGSTARASATATSGVTTQFTPAPGITVTVHATPTRGTTSSSSTTSYTGGAGGTTSTVPPRYPTPLPTSGGFGGGATPTATTPVNPTPTPTGGAIWRPGPTPTATPVLPDSAELVSYTPTGPITQNNPSILINATYLNSGPSTWTPNYKFLCRQFCGASLGGGDTFYPSIVPGQSFTFTGGESISSAWAYQVNTTIWQLWSPTSGYFGPQVKIEIINHGWYTALQEASPDCMGDGSVWTRQGSTGTVSCGGSGLAMADGGSNGVSLDLHSTPASYDPGNYSMKVHIHFNTSSPSVFAGVIITEPTATATFREVVMVSPAGYMCSQTNTAYCLPPNITQQIIASQDYDLTVTVSGNGTLVSAVYKPGAYFEGGITAGGLTGLIEVASSGVTDAAYFTNYTLYQYK